MDPIDHAVAFCSLFNQSFPAEIRGAAPDRIEALEARLGRPISAVHRRFLERLGAARSWLDFGAFDPSLEAVLSAHERTHGAVPAGYELFAVATDEPNEDAYLVTEAGGTEPIVASFNTRIGCDYGNLAGDIGTSLAGSLPELICRQPLERFLIPSLPLRAVHGRLEPEPSLLERFDAVSARLSLTPLWFSSSRARIVFGGSTIAIAQLSPEQSFVVTVASADRARFESAVAALEQDLALPRAHPSDPRGDDAKKGARAR